MAKSILIKDNEGRLWRKYTRNGLSTRMLLKGENSAIGKNKTAILEAYSKGYHIEVMQLEIPVRTGIAALNSLFQNRNLCFYKDLHAIIGSDHVFTTDDLVKIETENGSKHAMLNTKYHLVEFKYTCLSTIILSIVSKVFVNKPEWKDLYDRLSEKYYIGNKVINLEREKRHKFKEMEKVRRESKRKFLDKKKSHPHLIYTPMGNKR